MKWITEVMEEQSIKHHKEFIKNFKPKNMENNFPRRAKMYEWTPAEKAINDAVIEVEKAGADTRLTEATILLQKAQGLVADFVDEQKK